MLRRVSKFLMVALVIAVATPAVADDASKAQKVAQLLELTGAAGNVDRVLTFLWPNLVNVIAQANPAIPRATIDSMQSIGAEEFHNAIPDLLAMSAKVYEANLTEDEVDAMITFYQSPLGRSAMSKMPVILQQSMAAGQSWGPIVGQKIATRIAEELRKKGYDVKL